LNDWFHEFLLLKDFFHFINNGLIMNVREHFQKLFRNKNNYYLTIPIHPYLVGTFDSTAAVFENCLLNCICFDFWRFEVEIKDDVAVFKSEKTHVAKNDRKQLKVTKSLRKNLEKLMKLRQVLIYNDMQTDNMFSEVN
jgi:hypothetical protein